MITDNTQELEREQRQSFIFYRSFEEAIRDCPDSVQLDLYKAITKYAFEQIEPQFTDQYARICWKLIKPQLDANWRRFVNGCKGGEFGNLGGAPKGNKNAAKSKTTPKQPQNNP